MNRRFYIDALHIVTLSGFAIAQPIYDLVGQNSEFFVAHRLGPIGILIFVFAFSIGVPLTLVLAERLVLAIRPSLQRRFHLLLVFLLIAALISNSFSRAPWSSYITTAIVITLAGGATYAYSRVAALRSITTVLSAGILVFPIIFLLFTPVSSLVFQAGRSEKVAVPPSATIRPTPIVFIIFDEFEIGALLDEQKNIDAARFPNFAALAQDSWWFPNATSVRWDTPRAVPAILTGRLPRDVRSPPTLQNHPDNLFTWLGGSYRFNVAEPLTNLCPDDLCSRSREASEFDPVVFLSDIAVLYLHIVLPAPVSSRLLPPMDGGWKGFVNVDHDKDPDSHGAHARQDRRDQLNAFLERIDASDNNTLHFLHVLLPHTPYAYLPSGAMYPAGDAEGLGERRQWVMDDHLPALAYHRNLLQIGFVDTYIGRLVTHLKSIGLYESAMIVITADHGKSFRPGQFTRKLTEENASDLLQVPLFLKLPGQGEGRRSERRVRSIDIIPTIADALGTELPWKADGVSMIGATYPERDTIEIVVDEMETMKFDAAKLTSYPRLPWKLTTFGARRPWSHTAIADRYSDLVGRGVAELRIEDEPSGLEVASNQMSLFDDVRPQSGMIPAILQGTITAGGSQGTSALHLAVAVNGIIRVTTKTVPWAGSPFYFMAIIPEDSLREGVNSVEIFKISGDDSDPRLSPIEPSGQEQFQISTGPENVELLSKDNKIAVRADAVQGVVERAELNGEWMTFLGWAVDPEQLQPATKIVIFAGAKQVYAGAPNTSRLDLERTFKSASVRDGGFRLTVRKNLLQDETSRVRVFGISRSGTASELRLSPGVKAAFGLTN